MNNPFKCKCGHDKFGRVDDYGYEYSYCMKCFTPYDDEGNELEEGEPPEYDPDDPSHERDINEDELQDRGMDLGQKTTEERRNE